MVEKELQELGLRSWAEASIVAWDKDRSREISCPIPRQGEGTSDADMAFSEFLVVLNNYIRADFASLNYVPTNIFISNIQYRTGCTSESDFACPRLTKDYK